MLIGGEWVEARSGETFETVNPFTGQAWAEIPRAGPEDVDAAVRAARAAFDDGPWHGITGTERARLMRGLAELIAKNAERIAIVETTDNGKLIREMEGQLRGLADYYHWFAGAADKIHGETIPVPPELPHLHRARAGRRGGGDHAVELAGAADELEARAGARGGLHLRRQAGRAGASRPASSTSSPASGPRLARRWSHTPTSTRSPSPARRRQDAK
jgi:hypothetical protein